MIKAYVIISFIIRGLFSKERELFNSILLSADWLNFEHCRILFNCFQEQLTLTETKNCFKDDQEKEEYT